MLSGYEPVTTSSYWGGGVRSLEFSDACKESIPLVGCAYPPITAALYEGGGE